MDLTQLLAHLDFQWAYNQLATNQFLIAAVFAAISYSLKSIPNSIWQFIKRNISMEFTVTNEDYDYESIVKFVEKRRMVFFTRTYSKKTTNAEADEYSYNYVGQELRTKKDIKKDYLSLGYGKSWFLYKGRLGSISRNFKDNNHSNKLKEDTTIQLFSRSRKILSDLLIESINEDIETEFNSIKIFMPSSADYWIKTSSSSIRSIDSVFIDKDVKIDLFKKIDAFVANKKWYIDRGIPYKLGIFIDGMPGTGKSSLIRAIATYMKRNIYFFSAKGLTETAPLLSNVNVSDGILVFEDFDTFSISNDRKDDKENSNKENLSILLNTLDGSLTPDGLIFIATTNYPDKIDDALKRKGRFDHNISLNELSVDTFARMVGTLYDRSAYDVFEEFRWVYKPIVGATVQDVFMTHRDYSDGKKALMELFS